MSRSFGSVLCLVGTDIWASSNNFSFKCHRRDSSATVKDQSLVFAVNDISFHPIHGTFSTCGTYGYSNSRPHRIDVIPFLTGSDGSVHFWDKDARTRLKCTLLHYCLCSPRCNFLLAAFDPNSGPVVATCFNRTGSIFAYAVSYDWSKGHSGMTPQQPNKLMLHACKDDEVKKRAGKR